MKKKKETIDRIARVLITMLISYLYFSFGIIGTPGTLLILFANTVLIAYCILLYSSRFAFGLITLKHNR